MRRGPSSGSRRAATAPPAADPPLGAGEFSRLALQAGLRPRSGPLAVAVSGGADSLALAHLAAPWARAGGRALTALVVDHGLRPGSGREAAAAAAALSAMGVAHETLRWRHGPVGGSVQAAAREARYALLGGWCRREGARELLVAHHQDDQAETLLLRLAAGSGPSGLAAMRARTRRQGIDLVRPLLGVPRARLRATLRRSGIPWSEDPSNDDPRHGRTGIRRLLADPGTPLPSPPLLARAARAFGRLDDALAAAAAGRLAGHVLVSPLGTVAVGRAPLRELPGPVARRALGAAVQAVAGGRHPPRSRRIEPLLRAVAAGGTGRRTLSGVLVGIGEELVTLAREGAAVSPPVGLGPGETAWWDGRFRVENAAGIPGVEVGALGADGLREARRGLPGGAPAGHPRAALLALPAFRGLDGLVSVPHLRWWREPAREGSFGAEFDPPAIPPGAPALPAAALVRQDGTGPQGGRA